MKKHRAVLVAALAGCVLLAGCAGAGKGGAVPQPTPTLTPTLATPTPQPDPTTDPTADPPLPYDEIRPIGIVGATPNLMITGYFTMSQNGRWGLLRADGTELLPCTADIPVSSCGVHWCWFGADTGGQTFDAFDKKLEDGGDGSLCLGHGYMQESFFYDLDWPGRDTHAWDPSGAVAYVCSEGPGTVQPISEEQWDKYGDMLPVFDAHELWEEEAVSPGEPVGEGCYYVTRNGDRRSIGAKADTAGWFFDQPLAPVAQDGLWAYIDREGALRTDMVYAPTYGNASFSPEDGTDPVWAACMQNGYAAVCRGGKWGLIDATGTEVIPAAEQGAAWEGTTLWVKQADGWHKTALPG